MLLKLSITDEKLPKLSSGKTSIEIWTHLKSLHETSNKSRALFHKNMLFLIMMDVKMSLQNHLMKIKDIHNQLKAIGCKIEEEDMVVITLKSLPRFYEHFIETLNISSTNHDIKFDELCNKLLQRDRSKKQFGSNNDSISVEQAFTTKTKAKASHLSRKDKANLMILSRI